MPMYILADDLAGAHDVAVPFVKRDFAVAVLSDPDRLDRFDSADLIVLNTNTRSCSEAETADRVGAACDAIRARSGALIYKKIDSTLRGHVGFEIDLVSDRMDFDLAICAPAYPEMGRTTVGGYQLLHGVPLRSMDMAGPDIPPQRAYIPDLLGNGSQRKTVHIDLKTVQGGSAAIRDAVDVFGFGTETTVVVDMADPMGWNGLLDAVLVGREAYAVEGREADAVADREADAERRSPTAGTAPALLCGSGGMAGALAERLAITRKPRASSSRNSRTPASSPPQREGRVLVFACSLHDTTTRQVEEVAGRASTIICPFDPLLFMDERRRGDETDRLTKSVTEVMANDRNAVVTPERPDRSQLQAWLGQLSEATGGRDPASVVIENLGMVARRLFAATEPRGIVLTGGETAGSVFQELNADGAWILDGIEPGVALAAVAGGPRDGMGVVIKPGSFGDEHTLAKAVDRLDRLDRPDRLDRLDRLSPNDADAPTGDSRAHGNRRGSDTDERPIIGITLGDPNGVGPEIIARILSQGWVYELCRPLVIGNDEVIRRTLPLVHAGSTKDEDGGGPVPVPGIHRVDHPAAGFYRHGTVDVLNAADVEIDGLKPGREQADAGRLAVESVKLAARLAMAGDIAALVTAPMNKAAMGLAGYAYAGHTELLAEVTGTKRFRLALAFDGILVSHATTHVSLRDAIDRLSEEDILVTIDLVGRALVGMGTTAPRIAVCGLNPHAGEGGLFGDEEIRIIAPALEKARERGWQTVGPLPPDTVFMRTRKGEFDGIIGMYHDQGHIPVKAIAFDRTVNVTLGLPIIRTSVDHGTAFDIAGRGIADAGNLGEALRMAVHLVGDRWSVGSNLGENAT